MADKKRSIFEFYKTPAGKTFLIINIILAILTISFFVMNFLTILIDNVINKSSLIMANAFAGCLIISGILMNVQYNKWIKKYNSENKIPVLTFKQFLKDKNFKRLYIIFIIISLASIIFVVAVVVATTYKSIIFMMLFGIITMFLIISMFIIGAMLISEWIRLYKNQ